MVKAPAITNRILLQHIQGMRTAVESRLERLEKRMDGSDKRMEGVDKRMGRMEHFLSTILDDVGCLKKDIIHVKDALQRLYVHRVSMLVRIEKLEEVVGIAQ